MTAGDRLYSRFALITSAEKLADRFLYTGSVPIKPDENSPSLLFSIEVTRPWFPSSRLVPTVSNVLTQRFSTIKRSSNPLKSFEAALKNINEELFSIAEQGETEWIGQLNSIIALSINDEVHIAQTGTSTAYLFRQRKISQITDESTDKAEPHPLTTFSNIISGQVTEGDRLVLSNQDLYSLISLDQIRAAVTDQTPWLAANQIAKSIRRSKVTSVSTAILALEKKATWDEAGEEDYAVNLDDNNYSWHKQAWKKAKPYVQKASELGQKAWHITKVKTKELHEKWQSTYGPKTKQFLANSAKTVGAAASNVADAAKKTANNINAKTKTNNYLNRAENWLDDYLRPLRKKSTPLTNTLIKIDQAIGQFINRLRPLVTGKNFRYIIILLVAIFLITTIVSVKGKHNQQVVSSQQNNNSQLLEEALTLTNKIDTVINQQQLLEAQSLLAEADAKLSAVKNPTDEQQKGKDALVTTLQEKSDKLNNTTRLTSTDTLEAPEGSHNLVATDKGVIVFTAGQDARFFVKELAGSQQNFKVDDPIIDVTYNKELDEVIALTNKKTVFGIRRENDEIKTTKKENPLGDFADSQLISIFANNLYLLDNVNSLIWKYPPSGDNYQKGINQVEPADISVAEVKDMAIDGYIYILNQDGSVVKLLRGKPDSAFSLNSLPKTAQPELFTNIFTDQNTDYLYILENSNQDSISGPRVLVFTKDGLYVKQYAFHENLNEIKDFTFDTVNNSFWVLSDNQILEYQY